MSVVPESSPPSFLAHPELPEGVDRRPAWRPWTAWVALLAGFAGAILGGIGVGVIAALLGADYSDPPPAVNIVATVLQNVSLVGAALMFASISARPLPRHFGLRATRPWPAVGWALLAFVAFYLFTAVWVGITGADPDEQKLPEQLGVDESTVAMLAVAFLVAVVAPIGEELFFRGYFFGALRNWRGPLPAAIITGLLFGGIHAGSSELVFLLPLGFFGFSLCLLYQRTGSLYPCIGLHCVNNSLAFGVSQGWGWEIAVLVVVALATVAVALRLGVALWGSLASRGASALA